MLEWVARRCHQAYSYHVLHKVRCAISCLVLYCDHYFLLNFAASESGNAMKPLLIIDARSYTAAFANRAKGGGFEYPGRGYKLHELSCCQTYCVVFFSFNWLDFSNQTIITDERWSKLVTIPYNMCESKGDVP